MRIQTSLIAGVIILLVCGGLIFLAPTAEVQDKDASIQRQIPVVVKPLMVGGEIVPIEIKCDPVFANADTIERFNCLLINGTDKDIRASSVRYTVISEKDGAEQRDARLDVADTYINPDLAETKKAIAPGGQLHVMAPGPVVEPDSEIKALELEPVYIEFSDGTTVGKGAGADMIAEVRDGAAKFKDALRREFRNKGRSVSAILARLDDAESTELDGLSGGARVGANAYRRFLLEKYKKGDTAAIAKVLEK